MPQSFWLEEYRKKAALADAVAQTGRGNTFHAVEFLYAVKQAVEYLQVRPEHDVLDVGCANGLLDIPLSAICRSLVVVEPVAELANRARDNLSGCGNVEVRSGHAGELPVETSCVDRVLLWGVLQLIAPAEIDAVFRELRRVLRPGGQILIGSIPDALRKSQFLDRYLEGVRTAEHLSAEQKRAIVERNQSAHWYDVEQLAAPWASWSADVERIPLSKNDPDCGHRYHLRISLPGDAADKGNAIKRSA